MPAIHFCKRANVSAFELAAGTNCQLFLLFPSPNHGPPFHPLPPPSSTCNPQLCPVKSFLHGLSKSASQTINTRNYHVSTHVILLRKICHSRYLHFLMKSYIPLVEFKARSPIEYLYAIVAKPHLMCEPLTFHKKSGPQDFFQVLFHPTQLSLRLIKSNQN